MQKQSTDTTGQKCTKCKQPAANGKSDCRRCNNFKYKYGLNSVEVDWMKFMQGYKCAIEGCDNNADVVDHNHSTGAVRQMLCTNCNTNLSVLESPMFAEYIKYLSTHA